MLVTLAEVKSYLGITDNTYDDFLNGLIALYSSAVEHYVNRKILAANYIQTFYKSDYIDPARSKYLEVYHFPLNTVTSIKEITTCGGVDTEVDLTENVDFRKGSTGRIWKLCDGMPVRWFANLSQNSRIVVEYNAGYAETPLEIKNTIYQLIEDDYNKKVNGIAQNFGSDTQRVSIPGVISIDFDYSLQANERSAKFGMLIGNYSNILDYWRSMRILTGNLDEVYLD